MSLARKIARTQAKKGNNIQAALQGIGQLAQALDPINHDLNEARYLLAAILEAQEKAEAQFTGFRQAVISYLQKLGMPEVETAIMALEADYLHRSLERAECHGKTKNGTTTQANGQIESPTKSKCVDCSCTNGDSTCGTAQ